MINNVRPKKEKVNSFWILDVKVQETSWCDVEDLPFSRLAPYPNISEDVSSYAFCLLFHKKYYFPLLLLQALSCLLLLPVLYLQKAIIYSSWCFEINLNHLIDAVSILFTIYLLKIIYCRISYVHSFGQIVKLSIWHARNPSSAY